MTFYDPASRIARQFKNSDIQRFLLDLRFMAQEYLWNQENQDMDEGEIDLEARRLALNMQSILEDDIALFKHSRRILEEYDVGDRRLETLADSILVGLKPESFDRIYMVRQVCDGVLVKPDEAPRSSRGGMNNGKCDFHDEQNYPVGRYVLEKEFAEEGRFGGDRITSCDDCGRKVTVWATANMIETPKSLIVSRIVTRLKSGGRRNAKLTEVICHDADIGSTERLRSLDDDYGIAIILKPVDESDHEQRRHVRDFISKWCDKSYLASLGMDVDRKLPLGDQLHYAMLCYFRLRVDDKSIFENRAGIDDLIADPKILSRVNGNARRTEPLSYIRAPATFLEMPLEVNIKSEDVWVAEKDPDDPRHHTSYARRELERREANWTPAHYAVYSVLNDAFRRMRLQDGSG